MSDRIADDAGFTLLELAIAMMIIAIGLAAVLGALVTSVNSGRIQRDATHDDLALLDAAEVLRSDSGYVPCPSVGVSTYQPSDPGVEVTVITHWDGDTGANPLVFLEDCPTITEYVGNDPITGDPIFNEIDVDYGLQQVVLAQVVDDGTPRQITVVKSDPDWEPQP